MNLPIKSDIEVIRFRTIRRHCDDPRHNFAKIRTLAKTDDGKIVQVNQKKAQTAGQAQGQAVGCLGGGKVVMLVVIYCAGIACLLLWWLLSD